MPDYRRWFVAGGSFFFTVVVDRRRPLFRDGHAVALLGQVLRECHAKWPFTVAAIVLLHDHLHAIWTLPPGDAAYPTRWGWLKKEFTQRWLAGGGRDHAVSGGRGRERRRGIWQPRYWEHTLEDEIDFERHFDYVHWNPVKHRYVRCPHEWPHSTFHQYVDRGVYEREWGCFAGEPPASFHFKDISDTVGE
jgi:putative transposase